MTLVANPFQQDFAELETVKRMSRDLRTAAGTLSSREARFLTDLYYQVQDNRIRAAGQIRSMTKEEEPHSVLEWFFNQSEILEQQMQGALERYVKSSEEGRWLLSITGIGPVIAAGLLAHINIERAPTAGHIWSFAGFDPSKKWEKGQIRPWNPALKVLCYKAGESFVKVQNSKTDFYGKLFVQYKEREWRRNLAGAFQEQAEAEMRPGRKMGKDTIPYVFFSGAASPSKVKKYLTEGRGVPATYRGGENIGDEIPMLYPGHIHARARRIAVKIFLSHLHEVLFRIHYGEEPPMIFAVAHLNHVHKIEVPNKFW